MQEACEAVPMLQSWFQLPIILDLIVPVCHRATFVNRYGLNRTNQLESKWSDLHHHLPHSHLLSSHRLLLVDRRPHRTCQNQTFDS